MRKLPTEITTHRLALRPIRAADAAFVFTYASDPETTRFVSWRAHRTIQETIHYLSLSEAAFETGEWFEYLITLRTDGTPLGAIAVIPDGHAMTVGYVLAKTHWGQGFAAEATAVLVKTCMALPHVFRVWTVCDAEHTASAKVLEKAGMKREGLLGKWKVRPNLDPEKPRDCYCYAVLKD